MQGWLWVVIDIICFGVGPFFAVYFLSDFTHGPAGPGPGGKPGQVLCRFRVGESGQPQGAGRQGTGQRRTVAASDGTDPRPWDRRRGPVRLWV